MGEVGTDRKPPLQVKANPRYKCQWCKDTGTYIYDECNEQTRAVYGDDRKVTYAKDCPFCSNPFAKSYRDKEDL